MNKKHKLFSFLFLLGFTFQILTITLNSTLSAQSTPQSSPQQTAMAFAIGRAFEECTNNRGLYQGRSANDLRGGNVFGGRRATVGADSTTQIGYLVDDDGKLSCTDGGEINNAVRKIGYENARDFFETAGIYRYDGNSDTYELESSLRGDNPATITKIKAEITKKFGVRFGSTMPDAAQYAALRAAFEKGCEARRLEGGKPVVIVNNQGETETVNYQYDNTRLVSVGFGLSGDGRNDGQMECQTIVDNMRMDNMRNKSGAYARTATDNNPDNDPESDTSLGTNNGDTPTCETSGSSLSWIICPIVTGIAETSDTIFNEIIQPLLVSRDLGYTNPNDERGLFSVWSSFRVIANIVLILALLIIVFGQSIGGGLIDAYTVKKALPRVFVAAILINISIYLVVFALDISNIVGQGLNGLLLAPFQANDQSIIKLSTGGSISIALGTAISGGALFAAAGFSGGGVLILVLLGIAIALLAFLAVLITLIIRQGLIILLVLLSPLAFAMYVLPNTEQYFKKWWNLLFKTLLVYPIIMAILAISYALSSLLDGIFPQGVQWAADIVSILLLVIPLFLVPFAFKMAGGAMGSLFGMLNNNPLKKLAGGAVSKQASKGFADTGDKLHRGEVFRGARDKSLRGRINRGAGAISNLGSLSSDPRSWGQDVAAAQRKYITQRSNELLKADEGWTAGNDDAMFLAAQAGMTRQKFISDLMARNNVVTGANYTEAEARQALSEMETSFGAKVGTNAMRAAAFKAYAASNTGVGTDIQSRVEFGNLGGDMIRDGVMSTQDVVGAVKSNRSRGDLTATGFVDQMKFFEKGAAGTLTAADAQEHIALAYDGIDPREIAGSHKSTAEVMAKETKRRVDEAIQSRDRTRIATVMAEAAGMYDVIGSTSKAKADKFAEQVFGQVPVYDDAGGQPHIANTAGGDMTIREIMEDYRADPTFLDKRREYSSRWAADANNPGVAAPDPADPTAP